MPKFFLHISDSKEAEVEIEARNAHEAMNDALNALSRFACRSFPPPENVAIAVQDEGRSTLATLRFSFQIDYVQGVMA